MRQQIPFDCAQGGLSPRLPQSHLHALGAPDARDLRMTSHWEIEGSGRQDALSLPQRGRCFPTLAR